MNKIPVWHTVSQTYGFAFGRYLPILGAIWLPLIVMAALGYFFVLPLFAGLPQAMQDIAQHARQSPGTPFYPVQFFQSMRWMYLYDLLVLLLYAPIAVGVTQEALGIRKGPRFVYLSFGTKEMLVIGGWIAIFAIFYAAIIVVAIAGVLIGVVAAVIVASNGAAHAMPNATPQWLIGVAVLAIFVVEFVLLYIIVRLSYLMVPVTAVEGKFGVFESWRLTKGNFWRIFAILFLTLLPIVVIELVVMIFAFGPTMMQVIAQAKSGHPDPSAPLAAMMQTFVHVYAYALPIGLVIAPVLYGIFLGQSAFAYRALVPKPQSS
jgi:hypothetical protein